MAREVVTRIWCDVCFHEGEHTEAEELPPVTIGNTKPRLLALCERHRKEFYDPFQQLLSELGQIIPGSVNTAPRSGGQSAPARTPTNGGISCPLDCGSILQNRDSLNGHTTRVHNKTLNEILYEMKIDTLYDINGIEVPGPRPEKEPEIKRVECPLDDCDKVYEFPKYRRPGHALSIHLTQKHGLTAAERERALTSPAAKKGRARKAS